MDFYRNKKLVRVSFSDNVLCNVMRPNIARLRVIDSRYRLDDFLSAMWTRIRPGFSPCHRPIQAQGDTHRRAEPLPVSLKGFKTQFMKILV
jgi:hypothetical protein